MTDEKYDPSISIDDMLLASTAGDKPNAPEDSYATEAEAQQPADKPEEHESKSATDESSPDDVADDIEASDENAETDDYGNVKDNKKTYTEDEVNERINQAMRRRFKNQEPVAQQQQSTQPQQAQGEGDESWQEQLDKYIDQKLASRAEQQARQKIEMQERQLQAEFESKFERGMGRFGDFTDVVGKQPITDAMTMATRAMDDPASFLYAASKRAPQELKRISQIPDAYAQMVEMGKLEERMRLSKTTTGTKAPKPLGKITDDDSSPVTKKRELTIEELISQDAARRLAAQNRHRRTSK